MYDKISQVSEILTTFVLYFYYSIYLFIQRFIYIELYILSVIYVTYIAITVYTLKNSKQKKRRATWSTHLGKQQEAEASLLNNGSLAKGTSSRKLIFPFYSIYNYR